MTPPSHDWNSGALGAEPGPELLAAYLDGELEGRDELAALRSRLEDWIAAHPEVRDEIQRQRRLRRLWEQTSPAEPAAGQWRAALENILSLSAARHSSTASRRGRKSGRALIMGAVAACLACVVVLGAALLPGPTQPWSVPSGLDFYLPEDDAFPVARSHEVEVLVVAGADTASLPIGRLPVQGELELVGHDDIAFGHSNARVIFGVNSPMAWERLRENEP
jgi:hypothetical protein